MDLLAYIASAAAALSAVYVAYPFAAREAVGGGECDEGEEGQDGLRLEHPREAAAVRDQIHKLREEGFMR